MSLSHDLQLLEAHATRYDARDISDSINALLSAVFALYVKSRNFQWHLCGSQFQDCHLLLEQQGDQLYSMLQPIGLLLRSLGKPVCGPFGHLPNRGAPHDDDPHQLDARNMLLELRDDNLLLQSLLRRAWLESFALGNSDSVCLIEEWLEEARRRTTALCPTRQRSNSTWR